MRHAVSGKKLNRSSHHRQALFKNLIRELIDHGSIVTTPAKAKAVQGAVDKLMTKAKKGGFQARRLIHQTLNHTPLVNKLVDVIAPASGTRLSGFTRISKLGFRLGDNAATVRLEWVDKPAAPTPVPAKTAKTPPKTKKATAQPAKSAPKTTPLNPPATREPKPGNGGLLKPGMIRQKSGER